MANAFTQYLRDTRAELRHVAWPTRTQTVVYALLVAAISIGVALYLGLFDFLFTAGLARFLDAIPQGQAPSGVTVTQQPATTSAPTINLPKKK